MTTLTLLHILLAVFFFFVANWIGEHSLHSGYIKMSVIAKHDEAPAFNFLYRAFLPIVLVVIASFVFYRLNFDWLVSDIYLVVVYYFLFRLFYNLATGKGRLLNWFVQVAYITVSVPFAYVTYYEIISKKQFFFPSSQEIGSAVWLSIIAYIYYTINSIQFSDEKTKNRKRSYLEHRYNLYRVKYGSIIEKYTKTRQQELLIYAVMIYEAFNRPLVIRWLENVLFLFGQAQTLGIMQVKTDRYINDAESVEIGVKKIVDDFADIETKAGELAARHSDVVIRHVLGRYNPGSSYCGEVRQIFEELESLTEPLPEKSANGDLLDDLHIMERIRGKPRPVMQEQLHVQEAKPVPLESEEISSKPPAELNSSEKV